MMATKYIPRALRRRVSYEKLQDRHAICQEISRVFGVAEMEFDWPIHVCSTGQFFTIAQKQTSDIVLLEGACLMLAIRREKTKIESLWSFHDGESHTVIKSLPKIL